MTALAGVLVASLLGSVHCGAMCGAFACLANGGAQRGVWFHGGRLLSYLTLGVLAGSAGAGLNRAGAMANMQRTATAVASVALIVWGVVQLHRATRARRTGTGAAWGGVIGRQLARTAHWEPHARATAIGVMTGLLPCGWLWAFLATAMGTGGPWKAAAVMAVFWIGTVPMLLAVAAGARRLGPLARIRWPVASATLVLLIGLGELAAHVLSAASDTTAHTAHATSMVQP
jgi:uncharacterized protein